MKYFQDGTEALSQLRMELINQRGEEDFNKAYIIAKQEREIIDAISRFRKEHKVTQKELADALGTKYQQISKYERAEQSPSLSVLLKMFEALGLELTITSKENSELLFHT